jgi:bacterioferritin
VLEQDLIHHYDDALRFCLLVGDLENGAFFQALLADEQHHGEELGQWLRQLTGAPSYANQRVTF